MIPAVVVIVAASLAGAGADTIAFGVAGARAACNEHFSCANAAATKAALDDAASLGIRCADGDPACLRRLLAAEGYTRAVMYAALAGEVSVAVVETTSDRVRVGRGADPSAALKSALAAPPPPTPPTPTPPPPAPPATPTPPTTTPPTTTTTTATTATPAGDASAPAAAAPWPLIVAVASGAGAVIAGAAASVVSLSLASDLEAARRGELVLEDAEARNVAFWALTGTAVALAGVAAGATAWALAGAEPPSGSAAE